MAGCAWDIKVEEKMPMASRGKEEADSSSASYEYSSSSLCEESEEVAEYEQQYFGEASEECSESSSGAAWEDSDDDERIRGKCKGTATWLDGSQPKKQIEIRRKRLRFEYEKHLFFSKCNIKLARAHGEYLAVVDTYNNIYVLKDFKVHLTLRIEMFGVSDLVWASDAILLSSCKQSGLKEVSLDGEVRTISMRTVENVRKMVGTGSSVYMVGDQLALVDSNYEVVEMIEGKFMDVAVSPETVYAMGFGGDIVVLTRDLQVLRKASFEDKFDFRSIYFAGDRVFVGTGMGMKVFDKDMNPVKELMNLKDEPTGCIEHGEYVVYGSKYDNSLKIILPGLRCFNGFPFNSIRISPIGALSSDGRSITICSGRSVNVLRIKLE